MRIGNDTLNINADLSVSQESEPVWLGHIANFSIQVVFSGSPQGNFKLQMSNDEGNPTAAREADRDYQISNWTDIADSAFTVNAAGDVAWNYRDCGFRWVRVVWTHTGGSGTITSIRFNVKGV
jgi:hypothetical protein